MAATYMTPGVYVEEIPKFPPSIAPVETAIPAFIGYTEKAIRNGEEIIKKPTRIESIAEFEELFGKGPGQNVTVYIDTDDAIVRTEAVSRYYLYDSLRLFYANGGGRCFIVSVGKYPADTTSIQTDVSSGIEKLADEDEPTIIILPDAVSSGSSMYTLFASALAQCNKLKDRVLLCDVPNSAATFKENIDNFRNSIGINNLKYGMAYGPWINANLPRRVWRRNIILKRDGSSSGAELDLASLTSDQNISELIKDIKSSESAGKFLASQVKTVLGVSYSDLRDALKKGVDAYNVVDTSITATNTNDVVCSNLSTALKVLTTITFSVLGAIQRVKADYPDTNETGTTKIRLGIRSGITDYITRNPDLKTSILELVAHNTHLVTFADPDITLINSAAITGEIDNTALLLGLADGTTLLGDTSISVSSQYAGKTTDKEQADVAMKAAYTAMQKMILVYNSTISCIDGYEKSLNESLMISFGRFKELVTRAGEALNMLPPSGAVAGVYATVDRERGVWKAPANVSLNSVIAPAVKISHEQQMEFNVDVNAGKSINIIRSFTGKGTLVWGARTLAGNDNEWRYVNVRRFFNFVEESCKKATEQFVFEPNDANTWVRIQAMIENFLTTLWRQGALQGIKPEHAFYVAVGLGKTMTALDILEGRMIIEIGMAVVRPAEFIILRFSHKMPES